MLQSCGAVYQAQRQQQRSDRGEEIWTIVALMRQIDDQKEQLCKALTINNLLVKEASKIQPPAVSSDHLHRSSLFQHHEVQHLVKVENQSDELSLSSGRGRRGFERGRGAGEAGQQVHDKNETKNIPKNYGKAILSFIQKNIQKYIYIIKPILQRGKLTISDLLLHIKKHKKEVNSINYLKEMWGYQDQSNPILKCIRILSYVFMRKHCLSYIFNSRVKNYSTHIKYRKRIIEGIENPSEFTCIKQF